MLFGGLEGLGLNVVIFLVQLAIGPTGRMRAGRAVECGAQFLVTIERFGAVGAIVNDFGGGPAGDGPVHFVLHGFEKAEAGFGGGIVIDAGGVDVGDLLVEPPLRGADVLDAAEQLLEIVEGLVRVLEPLVVEDETLDDVFAQALGGPDAELGGGWPRRLRRHNCWRFGSRV